MILTLKLNLPEDAGLIRTVRHLGRTLLQDFNVSNQDIGDVEMIVGELSANAILHSQSSQGEICLTLEYHPLKVIITVEDRGGGFTFKNIPQPGAIRPDGHGGERHGGYGIPLVDALSDRLTFSRTDPDGTTVCAEKLLQYDDSPEGE